MSFSIFVRVMVCSVCCLCRGGSRKSQKEQGRERGGEKKHLEKQRQEAAGDERPDGGGGEAAGCHVASIMSRPRPLSKEK